jgi:hypothetical protein
MFLCSGAANQGVGAIELQLHVLLVVIPDQKARAHRLPRAVLRRDELAVQVQVRLPDWSWRRCRVCGVGDRVQTVIDQYRAMLAETTSSFSANGCPMALLLPVPGPPHSLCNRPRDRPRLEMPVPAPLTISMRQGPDTTHSEMLRSIHMYGYELRADSHEKGIRKSQRWGEHSW